jgi:large subunit ribosomal protein L28
MAQKCDLCGKGPQFGNNISHAHNTTRRRWNVNLQPVKAQVNGASKRMRVCTSCIKRPSLVIDGRGFSCFCIAYCLSKPKDALLMQYLIPVGFGPSGNT